MVFQQLPSEVLPVEIIAALTQFCNELSTFTYDVTTATDVVTKLVSNCTFINLGVDSVLVDITDTMLVVCGFLAGRVIHLGSIDIKKQH